MLTNKSVCFYARSSSCGKTSVDRTLPHLLCLCFVIIASVLVHMALIKAVGLFARCSIPSEMEEVANFGYPYPSNAFW